MTSILPCLLALGQAALKLVSHGASHWEVNGTTTQRSSACTYHLIKHDVHAKMLIVQRMQAP